MILLCQKNDYLISRSLINGFLGCPIPHAHIGHFRYFPPVYLCLDAWGCVTSQNTNNKEPAIPVYWTVPFTGLSSILFVWKSVSVSKNGVEIFHILPWMWQKKKVNVDDQNGQHHSKSTISLAWFQERKKWPHFKAHMYITCLEYFRTVWSE